VNVEREFDSVDDAKNKLIKFTSWVDLQSPY
jgi:hypothetical protein